MNPANGDPPPAWEAVVFAGPSIDRHTAHAHFHGELLPPITRGDVAKLLARQNRPKLVGIIDGRFLQALAVAPKEVLAMLDEGIAVYGSSSMGALRAVECEPFGAVGVGRIVAAYRNGEIEADDEVAITYDPETLRPLSEPLINIRFLVQEAIDCNVISLHSGRRIVEVSQALYFPDRTYRNILRMCPGAMPEAEIEALACFVSSSQAPDQKHTDGLELLKCMNQAWLGTVPQNGSFKLSPGRKYGFP